jgi:hypothetical protein
VFVSPARGETTYIPDLNVSQRYDSNVYFSPKELLPPGTQSWDLISSLGGGLKVLNKSRLSDSELRVGANGNLYAYNTKISYVSTNVFAASNLTDWAHELLPGLKLRVSDAFLYTPESPAFLTGGKIDQSDVFNRGIQSFRANTFTNNFAADGGYSVTRSIGMRANYTYSIYRVGQLYVTSNVAAGPFTFFDTTVHRVSAGPTYAFDGGDTLFLQYAYVTTDQVSTDGAGAPIKFTSHTLQPEYVSTLLRGWTATFSGGTTIVEQTGARAFFSGRFALSNEFDRQTRVSVSVSRQAAPAYFGGGGAMISNVAQLYVSHGFSRITRLTVSVNYAHNESTPDKLFTIETFLGSASLEYKLTRSTKLSLEQRYEKYNLPSLSPFDRHVTTLMLSTDWK